MRFVFEDVIYEVDDVVYEIDLPMVYLEERNEYLRIYSWTEAIPAQPRSYVLYPVLPDVNEVVYNAYRV
jgi:hypothetical protein